MLSFKKSGICALLLFTFFSVKGQTITSRQNGLWSNPETWVTSDLSGTISTVFILVVPTSGISGSGTSFLTELQPGDVILNSSDNVVGTVQSISSNSSLTLTGPSIIVGSSYKVRRLPKITDNVIINTNVTADAIASVNSITVKSSKTLNFGAAAATEMTVGSNFTIESGAVFNLGNRTLNVGGNFINNGTFTAGTGTLKFNGTNQSISGATPNSAYNLIATGSGTLTLNSSTTILNNGKLDFPASKTIALNGNILTINGTLSSSTTIYGTSSSSLTFGNNSTRTALTFAPGGEFLQDLTINSSGGLQLNSPLQLTGTLTFPSSGKIYTSATNLLSLTSTATHANSSKNSYVSGPMSKVLANTDPFIFPVGEDEYRKVGVQLEGVITLAIVDPTTFKVQYHNDDPTSIVVI